jgi:hypothetical protein
MGTRYIKKVLREDHKDLNARNMLYALTPFRLDRHGKTMIKVGFTASGMAKRLSYYNAIFLDGVRLVALMSFGNVSEIDRRRRRQGQQGQQGQQQEEPKNMTRIAMGQLEREVFAALDDLRAQKVYSFARVRGNHTVDGSPDGEWFYATPATVHRAFQRVFARHPEGSARAARILMAYEWSAAAPCDYDSEYSATGSCSNEFKQFGFVGRVGARIETLEDADRRRHNKPPKPRPPPKEERNVVVLEHVSERVLRKEATKKKKKGNNDDKEEDKEDEDDVTDRESDVTPIPPRVQIPKSSRRTKRLTLRPGVYLGTRARQRRLQQQQQQQREEAV